MINGKLSEIDGTGPMTLSIDEIYLAALEKSTGQERSDYLDAACAGNDTLRRRIERLLRAQSKVGQFLESPAPEVAGTVMPSLAEGPGAVIGPYVLVERIGEGGFGIVYIAEQAAPVRRQVALKIIKPGMDTKEVLSRFQTELEVLSIMDHANIARVLDAGVTQTGRPYFVMELVRGVPMTDYCDEHKLSVHARLALFVQVCLAVQHAHQKGIIHRDIKPSNVLVAQHDGRPVPKVIDFGVAKAINRQRGQGTYYTRLAEMIGTPLYMSPEQAETAALDIDTRSDIYSLGVLLYELLTGRTPFDADRLHAAALDEIRRIIREEEPPRPSTRIGMMSGDRMLIAARRHADPDRLSQVVRGDLDWIVMKSLEKDRARRYETANSLALDVQRYLADEPVQASPPSAVYRLRKFARRNKGIILASAAVLLSLIVGIIGTTWGMLRATDAEVVARQAANQKQIALAAAQASERKKSEQLWESLVAQARALRLSRRPGQRFESLETLKEATRLAQTLELAPAKFHEMRNAAIAALAVPDLYLSAPSLAWPIDALGIDFDEGHVIYARTDRAGNCSIRRVADDVEINRLPALGWPAIPRLSRDGKFVAITQFNRSVSLRTAIYVWQLDGPAPRQILSEPKGCWVDFQGSQLVGVAYKDGSIGLFGLPSARELGRLAPDTITHAIGIALHPIEPLVAAASYGDQVVQVRDTRTGKVLASKPQTHRPLSLAWHPDGRTLAVGTALPQICLYDRTTWQNDRTLPAERYPVWMSFDPAGERLAACDYVGNTELFRVSTGEKLMSAPSICSACRFGRDGLRLAGGVQNGKLGIWRVAGGQEYRALLRSKPSPRHQFHDHAAVHPDGRLFACAISDGIAVWDLDTGAELGLIPSEWGNNFVLFEPSGSSLLTLTYGGLSRWPIHSERGAPGNLSIGPPEALPLPNGEGLDQSRDGRVTVTCDRAVATQEPYAGGWILRSDRPNEPLRLDAGADIVHIAVSPNGRWVVSATHAVGSAKIWDARDGRFVKQLADWGATYPRFSPDGRWLSTRLDGGRLFAVGGWEAGLRLGESAVFAPDGKLAAVPMPAGLRLLDVASAREVCLLEDPNLDPITQVVFTPDGTRLVTVSLKGIHIWDLRLIRQQLKELGLDWEWPAFTSLPGQSGGAEPLRMDIHLGDKWVVKPPEESAENPQSKPSEKTPAKPKKG